MVYFLGRGDFSFCVHVFIAGTEKKRGTNVPASAHNLTLRAFSTFYGAVVMCNAQSTVKILVSRKKKQISKIAKLQVKVSFTVFDQSHLLMKRTRKKKMKLNELEAKN